ncbi:MAG TPA: 1-(5-phosphoribosyl)-5-[(5-phosphoribosylamino)methylideneamino] imidazole-4-carboxamide isomerase [Gaiellaceae bacterium]|nr:1-(5-phosphoribosyl)-5-[(5-phosphoribosylamino)methylideneamino] imidazole-4-carboxamide isomerase [Gaiellaceae bacterium]
MTWNGLQVLPAVDVLGEETVRLEQGSYDRVTVRAGDPAERARAFAEAGAPLLHVVDLDGARAGRIRPELVTRLVEAAAPAGLQVSGGVRSPGDVEALLAAGAERVVVGTAVFAAPGALAEYAGAFGERLVVAVDVRDGRVAVEGWLRETGLTAEDAAKRCAEAGVARLLCTAVERDGTLGGPDVDLLRRVVSASGLPVLAAGGIASEDDLRAVAEAGCEGAVVGRALLDGRLSAARLFSTAPR